MFSIFGRFVFCFGREGSNPAKKANSNIFTPVQFRNWGVLVWSVAIAAFIASVILVVCGSMYVHESIASEDTQINWPLYGLASFMQVVLVIILVRYTYKQAKGGKGWPWYIGFCVVVVIGISLAQTGLYNAIATPNPSDWATAGQVIGVTLISCGVIVFVGLVIALWTARTAANAAATI